MAPVGRLPSRRQCPLVLRRVSPCPIRPTISATSHSQAKRRRQNHVVRSPAACRRRDPDCRLGRARHHGVRFRSDGKGTQGTRSTPRSPRSITSGCPYQPDRHARARRTSAARRCRRSPRSRPARSSSTPPPASSTGRAGMMDRAKAAQSLPRHHRQQDRSPKASISKALVEQTPRDVRPRMPADQPAGDRRQDASSTASSQPSGDARFLDRSPTRTSASSTRSSRSTRT